VHWTDIHAWAEEFELWSTSVINAALIVGAVPAVVSYLRKMPPERIALVASWGATIGAGFVVTAFVADMVTSPHLPPTRQFERAQENVRLPPLSKEDRARFEAEKKKGMPDIIAWCRATSIEASDVDDCIIILSHYQN